nr:MAG TPA: hypothetical protein [Caudoviricetes sp.]
MALNLISLLDSQGLLAVGILYQIKKAPANARASTTTTMLSLLWSEGR